MLCPVFWNTLLITVNKAHNCFVFIVYLENDNFNVGAKNIERIRPQRTNPGYENLVIHLCFFSTQFLLKSTASLTKWCLSKCYIQNLKT